MNIWCVQLLEKLQLLIQQTNYIDIGTKTKTAGYETVIRKDGQCVDG